MNRKTLRALKGSIHKWRLIVLGEGKDHGTTNCPLCNLFYKNGCEGCPVMEHTRKQFCEDTPYDRYYKAKDVTLAREEYDFLKSLLPREAGKPAS